MRIKQLLYLLLGLNFQSLNNKNQINHFYIPLEVLKD
jgi:hypothetical protein